MDEGGALTPGGPAMLAASPPVHWLTAAVGTVGTVVVASICVGPLWHSQPKVAAPTVAFAAALVGVGVLLHGEPGQKIAARALILAGCLWPLGWVDAWQGGPWPLTAIFAGPLALVLTAWAIYRYPDPRNVGRWERRFLRLLTIWIVVGRLGVVVTSYPRWRHHPASSWWLTLKPDHGLNHAMAYASAYGQAVLVLPFLALWAWRVRQVRGLDRLLMEPVVLAAAVGGMASVATPVAAVAGLSAGGMNRVLAVQSALLLCVPIAFAVAALRRRLTSTVIADLVQRLRGGATPENLEQAFQEVLADPGLRVYYWTPDLGTHVDRRGQIFDKNATAAPGLLLPVTTATDEPLAVIRADEALRRYPDLVAAAVSVGALAVENARLQVATRTQLKEVRASHARIIEAGLAERQALERDLNTGALKRIMGLLDSLADPAGEVPPELAETAKYAADQLGEVVVELRDIAGGLHPSILDELGLVEAIRRMSRSQPVPVTVDLPDREFPVSVQVAAYFVIAEAITNAVRHAAASRIIIEGAATDRMLRIMVRDDGRGGADSSTGTGLAGLNERVHALGGDVTLVSPPNAGTTLIVEIPCG